MTCQVTCSANPQGLCGERRPTGGLFCMSDGGYLQAWGNKLRCKYAEYWKLEHARRPFQRGRKLRVSAPHGVAVKNGDCLAGHRSHPSVSPPQYRILFRVSLRAENSGRLPAFVYDGYADGGTDLVSAKPPVLQRGS